MVKSKKYVVARVRQLLDMFQDEDYLEYKKAIKDAVHVQPSVRGRKIKITCKEKRKSVAYVLPKYKNTVTEINNLHTEYKALTVDYVKNRDHTILQKMDQVALEIESLVYYDVLVNANTKFKIKKLHDRRSQLLDFLTTPNNDNMEHLVEHLQELETVIAKIHGWEEKVLIDYFIDELPQETTLADDVKKKALKKRVSSEGGPSSQIVKKILMDSFPFNKLPVKVTSKDECVTRSTKKPYYISLDDLRNAIAADDELKSIFGPGFKTMSKDKLCDVIFPQKK